MANLSLSICILIAIYTIVGANEDHKCPPNQVWTECTSACPSICGKPEPQICTLECRPPSCVCKPGYSRKGDECIKREYCCPPNQVWTNCTSACPSICGQPEPKVCTKECRPPSCVCKPGYSLKGNDCVKKEDCCK